MSNNHQEKDLDDPINWKESGNEFFNKGQYEDAIKCYAHAIELNPNFIDAWNNMGLSLLKIGKIEEAKKCNEKVKELKQKVNSQKNVAPSPPPTTTEDSDKEYCRNCGEELPYRQGKWPANLPKICPSCGVRVKDPIKYGSREGQGRTHDAQLKNPLLAALLSIIPGLGQAYNGQLGKAILFLFGVIIGSFIFVIPGIIVWIFGIYHANKTAKQMNYGDISFKETKLLNIVGYLVLASIFGFIAIAIALSISGYPLTTYNLSAGQSGLSTNQIKASAKTVPYDDLFRYNEQYIGDIIYYKGKIIQVQNTVGNNYVFRVSVKKSELINDYYEDILWLNYKGQRYLEGDIIQFWGKVKGLKEYNAILGNSVTIPEIDALIVTESTDQADQSSSPTYPTFQYTQTVSITESNSGNQRYIPRFGWGDIIVDRYNQKYVIYNENMETSGNYLVYRIGDCPNMKTIILPAKDVDKTYYKVGKQNPDTICSSNIILQTTPTTIIQTTHTTTPIISAYTTIPTSQQSGLSCSITGKWIQQDVVGYVYIQIYSDKRIEIYLNNQLRSWGTWDAITSNQFRNSWTGGADAGTGNTVTISSDCNTHEYVSFAGEHSTFIRG